MPTTKKKTGKVVDVAEVKEEIALVEEEANNETPTVSNDSGDQSVTINKEERTENREVVINISKADKAKAFMKKHWKKFAIGGGLIAAGVVGYKLGVRISPLKRLEIVENTVAEHIDDQINYLLANDNVGVYMEAKSSITGKVVYTVTKLVEKSELPDWALESTKF